jgi:hypothetical protein
MPRPGRLVAWLLLTLSAAGCAENVCVHDWDQRPVYVTGQVKFRGYPLNGGQIVFSADPEYGAGTELFSAELGIQGHFTLQSHHQQGLKPGYYRITLSSPPQSRNSIPHRYLDPATSGLRCFVEPDQPLRLTIELD